MEILISQQSVKGGGGPALPNSGGGNSRPQWSLKGPGRLSPEEAH